MNLQEWITTKPYPSLETARQLLNEPPKRRLINDYLLTDGDVVALRAYITTRVREFSQVGDLMVDDYPSQVTNPEDRGLFNS